MPFLEGHGHAPVPAQIYSCPDGESDACGAKNDTDDVEQNTRWRRRGLLEETRGDVSERPDMDKEENDDDDRYSKPSLSPPRPSSNALLRPKRGNEPVDYEGKPEY